MGIFGRKFRGGGNAGRGDNPYPMQDTYGGTAGPPRPNMSMKDIYMNSPRKPSQGAIDYGNKSAEAYQTSKSLADQYTRMSQNPYATKTARESYSATAQQHMSQADMHQKNIQSNARNLDIWRDRRS